jgi:hypothetical protein
LRRFSGEKTIKITTENNPGGEKYADYSRKHVMKNCEIVAPQSKK